MSLIIGHFGLPLSNQFAGNSFILNSSANETVCEARIPGIFAVFESWLYWELSVVPRLLRERKQTVGVEWRCQLILKPFWEYFKFKIKGHYFCCVQCSLPSERGKARREGKRRHRASELRKWGSGLVMESLIQTQTRIELGIVNIISWNSGPRTIFLESWMHPSNSCKIAASDQDKVQITFLRLVHKSYMSGHDFENWRSFVHVLCRSSRFLAMISDEVPHRFLTWKIKVAWQVGFKS